MPELQVRFTEESRDFEAAFSWIVNISSQWKPNEPSLLIILDLNQVSFNAINTDLETVTGEHDCCFQLPRTIAKVIGITTSQKISH